MSSKRDPDLLIKAFLDEGIDELPERSFDAVRAAIDQTRQWAVLGLWKEPQIMNATRLALLAAAIVVVAVVAIKFLPSSTTGPASTSTPTPTQAGLPSGTPTPPPPPPTSGTPRTAAPSSTLTPAPIASPSPVPTLTVRNDTSTVPIEAGTNAAVDPFLVPFTFTVPSGWSGGIGGPNLVSLNQSLGESDIAFEIFDKVYADPCHADQGLLNPLPGTSVADLVTALTKMPSVTASRVTDASIGGLPAKEFTLTAPNSFKNCTLTSDNAFRIWELPLGATFDMTPGDARIIWVLEVDGQRLVIDSSVIPGGEDTSVAGILNSITFTPQP